MDVYERVWGYACRHVGILEVHVLEGRDMRKMDAIGKSDPWCELYTQPSHKEKTVWPPSDRCTLQAEKYMKRWAPCSPL